MSTIAFVGGGVLATAGVVLYLAAPQSNHTTGLRIAPQVGVGNGRVFLQGTF